MHSIRRAHVPTDSTRNQPPRTISTTYEGAIGASNLGTPSVPKYRRNRSHRAQDDPWNRQVFLSRLSTREKIPNSLRVRREKILNCEKHYPSRGGPVNKLDRICCICNGWQSSTRVRSSELFQLHYRVTAPDLNCPHQSLCSPPSHCCRHALHEQIVPLVEVARHVLHHGGARTRIAGKGTDKSARTGPMSQVQPRTQSASQAV